MVMRIRAAVSREGVAAPVIEDMDLDAPGTGELLVRMVATGICHTDLNCHSGHGMPIRKPIVLGHEGAGVVDRVGDGVTGFAVGDHVVLSGASCGTCPSCQAAHPSYCDTGIPLNFGGRRIDGTSPLHKEGEAIAGSFFGQSSFATHALVPPQTAVKIDPDVPLHLMGPLGCGMITGAGAVLEAFRMRPGQSLAVFGTGGVGLAAVMAAKIAGAERIVAVDVDRSRLDLALELGATDAILSSADTAEQLRAIAPRGFDFSLNTTTAAAVFDLAFACLAKEGTAGVVTRPSGGWTPDMAALLAGGRKIHGILGGSANPKTFIPMLVRYWRQGRFPFDRLITEFAFDDIEAAWHACESGSAIKAVLRM